MDGNCKLPDDNKAVGRDPFFKIPEVMWSDNDAIETTIIFQGVNVVRITCLPSIFASGVSDSGFVTS